MLNSSTTPFPTGVRKEKKKWPWNGLDNRCECFTMGVYVIFILLNHLVKGLQRSPYNITRPAPNCRKDSIRSNIACLEGIEETKRDHINKTEADGIMFHIPRQH